jgi:Resolvase, N terminal domain
MPRHKYHRDRVYQLMGEPGPGSIAVGYVRYSSEMQDPASIVTQKRVITEFADKKGWRIVRWYVEPEQSAKYEDVDERPVFAQMLKDGEAGAFQVALCYANNRWSRNTALTFLSLSRLRSARMWWATADGLWDIDRIQQDGHAIAFTVDTQMNEAYIRQLSKAPSTGKKIAPAKGAITAMSPVDTFPPHTRNPMMVPCPFNLAAPSHTCQAESHHLPSARAYR